MSLLLLAALSIALPAVTQLMVVPLTSVGLPEQILPHPILVVLLSFGYIGILFPPVVLLLLLILFRCEHIHNLYNPTSQSKTPPFSVYYL